MFFKDAIDVITNPDFAKGCLVVNSLVDVVMQEELLAAKVKASLSNMEGYLTEDFRKGVANNVILVSDVGFSVDVMIYFLVGLLST